MLLFTYIYKINACQVTSAFQLKTIKAQRKLRLFYLEKTMTTPTYPNSISLLNVATEFDRPTTAISLSKYFSGGVLVPSGTIGYPLSSALGIPTGGRISLSNFHGSRKIRNTLFRFNASTTWVVPDGVSSVRALIVAGGGGGGGYGRDALEGGGGGGGGGVLDTTISVSSGQRIDIVVGAGGASSYSGEKSSFLGKEAIGGGHGGHGYTVAYTPGGYYSDGEGGTYYVEASTAVVAEDAGGNGGSGGGGTPYYGNGPVGAGTTGQGSNGSGGAEDSHSGGGGGAGGTGSIIGGPAGSYYFGGELVRVGAGGGGGGVAQSGAGGFGGGAGGVGQGPWGSNGTANTGGGGGGGACRGMGGVGGSGVVYVYTS